MQCNEICCAPQVHHLQVALNEHGYYCGEDETVWWQFGMDTYSSLLTFQVCDPLIVLPVRLTFPVKVLFIQQNYLKQAR